VRDQVMPAKACPRPKPDSKSQKAAREADALALRIALHDARSRVQHAEIRRASRAVF